MKGAKTVIRTFLNSQRYLQKHVITTQTRFPHVLMVVDYADTQISNFASEYLHENEEVRETVLACL